MGLGKKSSFWWLKKVMRKEYLSCVFRWKRLHVQTTIMDTIIFKILSLVEPIVLLSTLCFFYFCYGGHF
ncbi:hypothetical protein Lalb_Chr10g0106611 [Lupinus albus]|uniref:Uncharacterized protein n=1 Tax=Lupinus albus TaxID=3870 RepID=A0A6A4PXA1_LUPAL|nr:hypothetical protein Lalb_Chr10g0106611 [Lupinus albus]